jgi:quercetin dioxygenase-like cupin family protein
MVNNIDDLIAYSENGILSKVIIKSESLNVTLFCMAERTDISPHTSTKSGFIYVVEGDGIFNLEGKEIEMSRGVFISMDANAVHSLKARANTSFLLVLSGDRAL